MPPIHLRRRTIQNNTINQILQKPRIHLRSTTLRSLELPTRPTKNDSKRPKTRRSKQTNQIQNQQITSQQIPYRKKQNHLGKRQPYRKQHLRQTRNLRSLKQRMPPRKIRQTLLRIQKTLGTQQPTQTRNKR